MSAIHKTYTVFLLFPFPEVLQLFLPHHHVLEHKMAHTYICLLFFLVLLLLHFNLNIYNVPERFISQQTHPKEN